MHLMQIQRIKKKNVLKTLTALLMLRQLKFQPLKIFKNSYGTAHADCCRGAAPPFEHQLLCLNSGTFEHLSICTFEDQYLCLNIHHSIQFDKSHILTCQKF